MMSNFISPGTEASRTTTSEPCPTRANAAADTIPSVDPFRSTRNSGWVPTRLARKGRMTR